MSYVKRTRRTFTRFDGLNEIQEESLDNLNFSRMEYFSARVYINKMWKDRCM